MFFSCFGHFEIIQTQNRRQAIYRYPHCKVTKLKSKFNLYWASFKQQWSGARLEGFAKSVYCIVQVGIQNVACGCINGWQFNGLLLTGNGWGFCQVMIKWL